VNTQLANIRTSKYQRGQLLTNSASEQNHEEKANSEVNVVIPILSLATLCGFGFGSACTVSLIHSQSGGQLIYERKLAQLQHGSGNSVLLMPLHPNVPHPCGRLLRLQLRRKQLQPRPHLVFHRIFHCQLADVLCTRIT